MLVATIKISITLRDEMFDFINQFLMLSTVQCSYLYHPPSVPKILFLLRFRAQTYTHADALAIIQTAGEPIIQIKGKCKMTSLISSIFVKESPFHHLVAVAIVTFDHVLRLNKFAEIQSIVEL